MSSRITFPGHILLLGFGGVARCTLPLLLKHIDVAPSRITVMDMADVSEVLRPYIADGVTYRRERLCKETMASQLAAIVHSGDLIVDLAWNIDCIDMLQWCHDHDVLYVNTSVELWDPYENVEHAAPQEKTLYARHEAIRRLCDPWKQKGPTAVLEHGANPGLVSHFTKKALLDIAAALPPVQRSAHIREAVAGHDFPALSEALNVRAIHISELDTQVSSRAHDASVFRNTWSVEGLFEEGIAPAELGWGTHERQIPVDGRTHTSGPCNAICLDRRGMDTFVRTRVPSGEIRGMVIRHGEAVTISHFLTRYDSSRRPVYRPTVHYAYCPSVETLSSLQDVRTQNYHAPMKWEIMGDDITAGHDELGVLLLGHPFKAWWTGTILSIDEARAIVPHQNATTLQVAAAVLAAVQWMIRHPTEGVNYPDDLPHEELLAAASKYLGEMPSQPIDWTPTGSVSPDTWQFQSFLTADGPSPSNSPA